MERERFERLTYSPRVSERFLEAVKALLEKDSNIMSKTVREVGGITFTTGYLSTTNFTLALMIEERFGSLQASAQRVNTKGELEQVFTTYADGILGFYPEKTRAQTGYDDASDMKKALESVEQLVPLTD